MKKIFILYLLLGYLFLFSSTLLAVEDSDQLWQGDSCWRLKVYTPFEKESYGEGTKFFNPLYLYNKTRFYKGEKYNFGFVFRKGANEPSVTWDSFQKYYLIKYYLKMQNVFVDKLIIGNYKLQYNQGLVFYYPFSEMYRPVKIKAKGIKEDAGTNPNAYFSGVAGETKYQDFDIAFFYSNKLLDASLNSDGTVKTDLIKIREDYGYIERESDLKKQDVLREQLFGGRIAYNFLCPLGYLSDTHIGIIAYQSEYSPKIAPSFSKGEYLYRGDKNTVYGIDFETRLNKLNLIGEFAQSVGNGKAYLIQPMIYLNKLMLWTAVYKYDKDYYNEHSSAVTTDGRDEDINEEGIKIGVEYKNKKLKIQTCFDSAYHPYKADNLGPTDVDVLWLETNYKVLKNLSFYFRQWNKWYEKKTKLPISGEYEDLYQSWKKTRLEVVWRPARQWRLKTRYEYRVDTIYDLNQVNTGFLIFEDLQFKVNETLSLEGRVVYFDAPQVYVSEIEPLWKNAYVSYHWNTKGTGIRYYLIVTKKFYEHSCLWLKYENTRKTSTEYESDSVKLQYDIYW